MWYVEGLFVSLSRGLSSQRNLQIRTEFFCIAPENEIHKWQEDVTGSIPVKPKKEFGNSWNKPTMDRAAFGR